MTGTFQEWLKSGEVLCKCVCLCGKSKRVFVLVFVLLVGIYSPHHTCQVNRHKSLESINCDVVCPCSQMLEPCCSKVHLAIRASISFSPFCASAPRAVCLPSLCRNMLSLLQLSLPPSTHCTSLHTLPQAYQRAEPGLCQEDPQHKPGLQAGAEYTVLLCVMVSV